MKWLWSIVFVAVAATTTAGHAADMPNKFLGTWCRVGISDGNDLYKREDPSLHPGQPPCSNAYGGFIEITRDELRPRGQGHCPLAESQVVGRDKSAIVYRLTFPRCGIGWTAHIADKVLTVKLFDYDD